MESKICTKCGKLKPHSEFVKNSSKKDGLSSWCKLCKHEHHVTYYNKNKDKFRLRSKQYLSKIKEYVKDCKSCGCLICGEKDIACLDFHHTCGKDFTISQMMNNTSFEKIKEEISKCIVLCANCHRKLHYYNLQSL